MKDSAETVDIKTKKLIQNTLLMLGIAPHFRGFPYLEKAFALLLENDFYLYAVSKRLYPDVAACFGTTGSWVERAIRHAKEEAEWSTELWEELFQYISPEQKITNSYFFGRLLLYLKDALGECRQ